jgi:hypothetical protein
MVAETQKRKFLVLYDYGMGGLWAYLWSESEDRIKREYPELKNVPEPPLWMTEEVRARIEERWTFDIEDPAGWLTIPEKRRY